MKIAVVGHSHYPIKQPFSGGLEAHTYMLVEQLHKAGHEVTLFAASGSDKTLPCVSFLSPTAKELFSLDQDVDNYREEAYTSLMQLLQKSDFDIVHNNSLHYVPLQLAASLPMPMVTVLHTPPFFPLIRGFQEATRAPNHRVIAISKAVVRCWRQLFPSLETTLVYNGVNTQHWKPQRKQKRQAVWFGRITPEKGTHLAIKAALLAKISLRICGPVHDDRYFSEQVQPLLSRQVSYLGNLKTLDLAREVARASVSVCTPCWEEPFGLVAAEALASGTPIAGFHRGALPEILTSHTGILVEENTMALANAIEHAQRLSKQACRQRAVETFSMSAMIRGYTTVYQNLLLDRPQRSVLPLVS
jgi:glycosyltransferase involved in cell wall biosynthesis